MSEPRYHGDPGLPKARFKRIRARRGPSFLVIVIFGGVALAFAGMCCFSGLFVSMVEKALVLDTGAGGPGEPTLFGNPVTGERITDEQLLGGEKVPVLPVLDGLPPLPGQAPPTQDPGARPDAGVGAPPVRPKPEPEKDKPVQRGPSESELFGVQ